MSALAHDLATLDSLSVAVLTDDVSDNYVSKTPFAVSEFANVVRAGAGVISGEALNWRSGAPVHRMSWRPPPVS